ncbi:hypothetical protein GUJ93_ZPchr0010g8012 [Zizania palustris]|uniref:Uncharacterized protein n=1 Tax=Zizania palustris TaxID=103762 RepID=A0A8J5WHP7_ZIZPA|nr:hypothetical protein GUJ93_ZPchr0010g8012 [Zizania palustris]
MGSTQNIVPPATSRCLPLPPPASPASRRLCRLPVFQPPPPASLASLSLRRLHPPPRHPAASAASAHLPGFPPPLPHPRLPGASPRLCPPPPPASPAIDLNEACEPVIFGANSVRQ